MKTVAAATPWRLQRLGRGAGVGGGDGREADCTVGRARRGLRRGRPHWARALAKEAFLCWRAACRTSSLLSSGRRMCVWVGVEGSRREELWPSSAAVCWRRRRSNNPGSSPRVRWTWNREERYVIFTIAGIGADYAFMEHVLGGRIFGIGRVYVGRNVIANC